MSPVLPGNTRFCLRFYFSLRGELHLKTVLRNVLWLPRGANHLGMTVLDPGRFQPHGAGLGGLPAAAAGRPAGEDLDPGREVPWDLDRSGRHLPDDSACQGESNDEKNWVGVGGPSSTLHADRWRAALGLTVYCKAGDHQMFCLGICAVP